MFYCPPKIGNLSGKLKPQLPLDRVLYLYHHNSPEHILPGSCSDFSEGPSAINCAKPCTVSCPQPGSLECLQESIIDRGGFKGTCCCGQCDVDMTCAADDSSSNGVWKPLYPTICPEGGCGDKGDKSFNQYLDYQLRTTRNIVRCGYLPKLPKWLPERTPEDRED